MGSGGGRGSVPLAWAGGVGSQLDIGSLNRAPEAVRWHLSGSLQSPVIRLVEPELLGYLTTRAIVNTRAVRPMATPMNHVRT
jgi:hypothetical protein